MATYMNGSTNGNKAAKGKIGWNKLGLRYLFAFTVFAIISHIFNPYPILANLYSPLKIFVAYLLGYILMFFGIHALIAFPTVIVAKVIPTYRKVPLPSLLNGSLIFTMIILVLLIRGGWYANTH